MNVDQPDDRMLILAARRGDHHAAEKLFRRHWPAAWRTAYGVTGRRAMADDVAADAFERAFAALARFDEGRPFVPWLHRIVVNRSLDLLRAERRLVGDAPADRADPSASDPVGDRALLEAVATLPLQRRVVVVLRYGIGMGPDEIAKVLDLPSGTVHSRLARALEQLREHYEVSDVPRA